MKGIFIISAIAILYTYLFYPLIIYVWGTFFRKFAAKRYIPMPISVVLAVRNEEKRIESRILNLLDQEYPLDLVEIVVVSDGSDDSTLQIVQNMGCEKVKTFDTGKHVGKAQAINMGVEVASNDIIIFADARQTFSRNSYAELTAMFADENVGAVSGELVFVDKSNGEVREGVSLYWEYEKLIRRKESAVDSVVGASGSIYAMRKILFTPLPPWTILDDFLLPMRIVLKGYRVLFIRSARAFDTVSQKSSQEFSRKVRTLAGNFQAINLERNLLNPRRNRLFFQLVSHKLMRLAAPYFCLLALISNCFISGTFFHVLLALQLLFYSSSLLKFTRLERSALGRFIRVAWTFVVLNGAAVAGLWMFLKGREGEVWRKA